MTPASAVPEPTTTQSQAHRERRMLRLILALLLAATLLVSPLAFHDLALLFLLAVPFALTLVVTVLVLPLTGQEQAEHQRVTALEATRRAEADRHAIRTAPVDTLPQEDHAALLIAAAAVTEQHGIQFGSTILRDEDFLQAFHAHEIHAADFRHGDHLRYTFLMLRRVPAGLAEQTIAGNLRSYLRDVCGSEALFHATRTHAWFRILHAALYPAPHTTFAALLTQHGSHLRKEALDRHYSEALLDSEAARQHTVPTDRDPLPTVPTRA